MIALVSPYILACSPFQAMVANEGIRSGSPTKNGGSNMFEPFPVQKDE